MISDYIQNPLRPAKAALPASAGANYRLPSGAANALGRVLDRLRRLIVELDRKHRLALDHRRAIAHLESLTDQQLRDIGIARPDIERAVRHGKEQV